MQFMTKSTTSERVTAAISTVVAVAVLGVAVSAQQSRITTGDRLAKMESEVRLQFRLAVGHNESELQGRSAVLDGVLAAWRDSQQTAEDYQLLTDWLREAMVRSMPGSARPLAAPPTFSSIDAPTTAAPSVDSPTEPADDNNAPENAPTATTDDATDVARAAASDILDAPIAREEAIDFKALPAPTLADAPSETAETLARPIERENVAAREIELPAQQALTELEAQATPNEVIFAPQTAVAVSQRAPVHAEAVPATTAAPVAVNLSGLSKRIADYHQGLGGVATAASGSSELSRLSDSVAQLEQLAAQYDFVRLYYNALTAKERRFIAEPQSWEPQVDALRIALDKLRHDSNGDFLRPFDSTEGDEVDSLLSRLDAIATATTR